jgi:hypothetical protein
MKDKLELENQLVIAKSALETARVNVAEIQSQLAEIAKVERKAYEKAHSGTRVEPTQQGTFVIVRGAFHSDGKCFFMWVDGLPSWVKRTYWALQFKTREDAEDTLAKIRTAEKEKRKEKVA